MNKEQAVKEATKIAKRDKMSMAVVNAPIENAEENGYYGYCSVEAVSILFRWGTVEVVINP